MKKTIILATACLAALTAVPASAQLLGGGGGLGGGLGGALGGAGGSLGGTVAVRVDGRCGGGIELIPGRLFRYLPRRRVINGWE